MLALMLSATNPDLHLQLNVLFNPLEGVSRATLIAFPLLQVLGTWIVDLALLLRVFAVFPFALTRRSLFVGIFIFPVAIKIARLVLIVASNALWASTFKGVGVMTAPTSANIGLVHSPLVKAELVCQMVDHL
jgi:hypothetical protein